MPSQQVEKKGKSSEIAMIALDLFSEKGFNGTSIDDIAQKANIAKGTVYHYFDSKDNIFIFAIKEYSTEIQNQLKNQLKNYDEPVQKLYGIVELLVELCSPDDPGLNRLFIDVLQQSCLEGGVLFNKKYIVRELINGIVQVFSGIFLDGISKGVFKPEIAINVDKISLNLLAFLDGAGLQFLVKDNRKEYKDQIDFYLEGLITMISIKK